MLFDERPPSRDSLLLDPGCGEGEFIEGVVRWCHRAGRPLPRVVGVELHPGRAAEAKRRFADLPTIHVVEGDFLGATWGLADYVIGNPPYVPITKLSEEEKSRYRQHFRTATGRFDLYLLFFEQALEALKPGGRLVFVTPEKYLSVVSAAPLRRMLARQHVPEIVLAPEDTFPGLLTYPVITVAECGPPRGATRVTLRHGGTTTLTLPLAGDSVAGYLRGRSQGDGAPGLTLGDVTRRISCGVATGADRVFVRPIKDLPLQLRPFAYPTLSGRQLPDGGPPFPEPLGELAGELLGVPLFLSHWVS
jgi:adenine-specific DNA-methyltransferase